MYLAYGLCIFKFSIYFLMIDFFLFFTIFDDITRAVVGISTRKGIYSCSPIIVFTLGRTSRCIWMDRLFEGGQAYTETSK